MLQTEAYDCKLSSQCGKSDSLNLNFDGTTLSQKKLQGAAINGTVLSVNEIPDGSAESMIADISKSSVILPMH